MDEGFLQYRIEGNGYTRYNDFFADKNFWSLLDLIRTFAVFMVHLLFLIRTIFSLLSIYIP